MVEAGAGWDVDSVHVRAPGKINVFMRVGAVRDDGYHDVATAYQAVSLYEDVRAAPADDFSLSFGGSIDTSDLPTDDGNLAIKAAKLLAKRTGFTGGVRLRIDKHVPIAGGMGGGSADAAAALVACDALWGTDVGREERVGQRQGGPGLGQVLEAHAAEDARIRASRRRVFHTLRP